MPYLSELVFNPKQRSVFRLLGDSYKFHQWLMTAFPDNKDGGAGRVLYRIEHGDTASVALVQSMCEPNWTQTEILRARGPKAVYTQQNPFHVGQTLRFKLRANPTVCRDGKRHVWRTEQEQIAWLIRKGVQHGFSVGEGGGVIVSGQHTFRGAKYAQETEHHIVVVGIDFGGLLQVTDSELFFETMKSGIGAAKGFGCGLLSVALPWR